MGIAHSATGRAWLRDVRWLVSQAIRHSAQGPPAQNKWLPHWLVVIRNWHMAGEPDRADAELRLRHTEALLAVSKTVGSTLELAEVIRRLTREMVRIVSADTGSAWCFNQSRDQLIPVAGYHAPKDLLESFTRSPSLRAYPFIEEFLTKRGPVYSEESQADARFDHPLLRLLPHKSVLVVPMWLRNEIIGGVIIVWTQARHRLKAEESRLVDAMARQAAIAIENARVHEQQIAMESARRQLAELRAVTALANATAHELNNPLTVIVGRLQMLAASVPDEGQQAAWIGEALACGWRIKEIVARMRQLMRVETLPPVLDIRRSSTPGQEQEGETP
jgi:K+-sensing histidine kinase KdpD